MWDNIGREKRCFFISLLFLFPDVCYALLCIVQGVSPTVSAKSRVIGQVDQNSNSLRFFLERRPVFTRDSVDLSGRMSLRSPLSLLEIRLIDDKRRTPALEKLLLYAFSFEDRMHLDAVRRGLCCVHDWSWIAIDRSMKTRASWLEHLVRLCDSFFLSLSCLSVSSWKVRYTANRVAVTR